MLDDDHYDRARNDPRRFKVRYEDHSSSDRPRGNKAVIESRPPNGQDKSSHYAGRNSDRYSQEKHPRRNRSPMHSRSHRLEHDHIPGRNRGASDHRRERGELGYSEGRSKLSTKQSVSDRGHSPVAATRLRQEAEFRKNQTQHLDNSAIENSGSAAKYVPPICRLLAADLSSNSSSGQQDDVGVEEVMQPAIVQPADELSLIEERRKKREAIKNKHRGQATPALIQNLQLRNDSAPPTPKSNSVKDDQTMGELDD